MMKNQGFQSVAVTEVAVTTDGDVEMAGRPLTPIEMFTPTHPENAPAILTYSNINVSTKTTPTKTLLNNVHGSITGGFWAIMGK